MKVEADEACLEKYKEFKFRKIEARYIIYVIANETIVLLP